MERSYRIFRRKDGTEELQSQSADVTWYKTLLPVVLEEPEVVTFTANAGVYKDVGFYAETHLVLEVSKSLLHKLKDKKWRFVATRVIE